MLFVDARSYFFGDESSTNWNKKRLVEKHKNFKTLDVDIRDFKALESIYQEYSTDIKLIIHAAAQPSHDWAAKEPLTDF